LGELGGREMLRQGGDEMFASGKQVCLTCGTLAVPAKKTKGSVLVGLILLCFFFVPGLIYFVWKASSKYTACPKCDGRTLVPPESPQGRKLLGG
jgi:hypothetical protein